MVPISSGVPYQLYIEPRDKYDNLCRLNEKFDPSDDYTVDITELQTNRPIQTPFYWDVQPDNSRIALVLKLDQPGLYRGYVAHTARECLPATMALLLRPVVAYRKIELVSRPVS